MTIRPIKKKADYEKALSFIEAHFDAKAGSRATQQVEIHSILVEKFEDEHFPIEAPSPVEAIKFRMEQLGVTNSDLQRLIGQKGHISEIFHGKRNLSVRMMKNLHRELKIPAEILLGS